jgi:hypothetical protein
MVRLTGDETTETGLATDRVGVVAPSRACRPSASVASMPAFRIPGLNSIEVGSTETTTRHVWTAAAKAVALAKPTRPKQLPRSKAGG